MSIADATCGFGISLRNELSDTVDILNSESKDHKMMRAEILHHLKESSATNRKEFKRRAKCDLSRMLEYYLLFSMNHVNQDRTNVDQNQ